jgi:predicted transcriptional regulator
LKKPLFLRVLELLRDNQGLQLREISTLLESSVNKVRAVLYELKAKGYIEKAGKTYVLTDKGRRFLEYIEHTRTATVKAETAEQDKTQVTPQTKTSIKVSERITVETDRERQTVELKAETGDVRLMLENVLTKVHDLEKKIANLERTVRDIEKAIESLHRRKQEEFSIEAPIMPYSYAQAKLGGLLDKLIAENKLVRVGSLVVDAQFYSEFKSKFPIKVSDLDKLTSHERVLLEEMRKEALVILHAGREYRLID